MSTNGETIALLLPDGQDERASSAGFAAGAQRLVRDATGRICLEAVGSQEEFERAARDTGCFRRGKPIRDPQTREVIGYELEEVTVTRAARTQTRRSMRPTARGGAVAQRSL